MRKNSSGPRAKQIYKGALERKLNEWTMSKVLGTQGHHKPEVASAVAKGEEVETLQGLSGNKQQKSVQKDIIK